MNDDLNFWDVYEPEHDDEWHDIALKTDYAWKTDMVVLAAQMMRRVSMTLATKQAGLDNNLLGADMDAWLEEFES